jgi:hypothetical protein
VSNSGTFLLKALVKSGIEEAVKLNFAQHLEQYKSELVKEVEKLRSSLKNSETLFSKQLEAVSKLRTILRHVLPKKRVPDMDWHDACVEIAESFSIHADALDDFVCMYGAVLPSRVLKLVESAATLATDGTFMFDWDSKSMDQPEPTREAIETAEKLYEALRSALDELQALVHSQVDARIT